MDVFDQRAFVDDTLEFHDSAPVSDRVEDVARTDRQRNTLTSAIQDGGDVARLPKSTHPQSTCFFAFDAV